MFKSKKAAFFLSISQRMLLSFMLLLMLTIALGVMSILGMHEVKKGFDFFKKNSAQTQLILKIDADIAQLQRAIVVFSGTSKNASIALTETQQQQLSADIHALIENDTLNAESSKLLLENLHSAIDVFGEKIDSLQVQHFERSKLVDESLMQLFSEIDAEMSERFTLSAKAHKQVQTAQLWEIQHHIATAEVLAGRYFSHRELQLRADVESHFIAAINKVKDAKKNLSAGAELESLDELFSLLGATKNLFHQAVQADRNYLFLVNVVMAGESGELSILADKLKEESLREQSGLYVIAQQGLEHKQQLILFISGLAILVAIILAAVMGRWISRPLESITTTFDKLAKGESLVEIPGDSRQDEIGSLAKAANAFRLLNLRTQDLLRDAEQTGKVLREREQALEKSVLTAQEASLSKSQFLANMSHELRTPMNAILGMLALLRKTPLNSRQADYAEKSEGAAQSLLSLLNDILDISKAEAGKIELDITPFSLDKVMQNLAVVLSPALVNKPVELVFDVEESVPRYFLGDAMRLQQVLINLGGNAIKFTERGNVCVRVELQSLNDQHAMLVFKVQDSGIGIAPENHERIFTQFTQAEASTTRRFGGTGLGLAICQRLVVLMGGELQVNSVVGEGSCFSFSLPLPLLDQEGIAHLQAASQSCAQECRANRLAGMRILLVEDNLNNQQIAQELLTAEGAIVSLANHGQEALDILGPMSLGLAATMFDVVLMDLQMPVMDGLTAARAIRGSLSLTDLPIIAMTANAMASDREACLAAGMNDHIGKPFDMNQLIDVLCKYAGLAVVDAPVITIPAPITAPPSGANEIAIAHQIDLVGAVKRLAGNKGLYLRMLPKYLSELDRLPSGISAALEKEDVAAVTRALHSLKGLSATMGVTLLASAFSLGEKALLASDVSTQARDEILHNIFALVDEITPNIEQLHQALQAELA